MIRAEGIVLVKKGKASHAFERREVTLAPLQANEVQIQVKSFGLNYADVMARQGLYREAPPMPCVLGYEVVGTVSAIGSGVEESWIGKRVVAFTRFGGYATIVNTAVHAIAEIDGLNDEQALSLATQGVTAYYMVERAANVQAGEKVLVHAAAGGVGLALIQLCKRKGAFVCAKVGDASKMLTVKEFGADAGVDYSKLPYEISVNEWLNGRKLDVSFNAVAGETYKKDMQLIGAGGRLVLFGGAALSGKRWGIFSGLNFMRQMGIVLPIGLMMQSKSVLGVNMLKIADEHPEVVTECLRGIIALTKSVEYIPAPSNMYGIDALAEAHSLLESGKSVGKICVSW